MWKIDQRILFLELCWVLYCPVNAINYNLRLPSSYYVPAERQQEHDGATSSLITASYCSINQEHNVTNQTTFVDKLKFGRSISSTSVDNLGRYVNTTDVNDFPNDDNRIKSNHNHNDEECRTYLAPSTIPGAGYGIFAGVDFEDGDEITSADVVVPLYDFFWNNDKKTSLLDEYTWEGFIFPDMEEPDHRIVGVSFGIGALPNCFFPNLNVEEDGDQVIHDYAGLDDTSPGIGAFTPFHGRSSYAREEIQAYSELFVDYGYRYFETREDTYGLIPFLEDFHEADKMLSVFLKTLEKIEARNISGQTSGANYGPEKQLNDRLYYAVEMLGSLDTIRPDLYDLSRKIIGNFPSRTLGALPEDHTTIEKLLSNGGTIHKDDQRRFRDFAYLQEHGECMDNLEVKTSTIPDAGRGAFARRDIPKGSVVAPLPLIHLPDRRVLDIHKAGPIDPNTLEPTKSAQPIHSQLLLNYCFGHQDSSLLLCPYGVVSSMVNHAPSISINGKGPTANVEVSWSEKMTTHPEWREKPLSDWASIHQTGLVFEYIALRDIKEGEEILVDYGRSWQEAWNNHVTSWKRSKKLVYDLNNDIDSFLPLHSEDRHTTVDLNEYSNAINLLCYNEYREMRGLPSRSDKKTYPCKVIIREEDEMGRPIYTAEIVVQYQNKEDFEGTCYELFDGIMFDVPRDAFSYGDQFDVDLTECAQPKTFRHELAIPDKIFPVAWRNHLKTEV